MTLARWYNSSLYRKYAIASHSPEFPDALADSQKKTLQHPTGTICKLLPLIADYIQLDFNSETTLWK